MAEVSSAYVALLPSAKGFGSELEQQVAPEVKRSGTKVGAYFGGALKTGAKVVVAAAGTVLGTALFQGFKRLDAIDKAKASLAGLGSSTQRIQRIMNNALTSVKGTAFGLGDASTVAASAVAAGIAPGRQLTKTLTLVADAATIGKSSIGEMGAIFDKVATSNKVQGDTIDQLNSRGIPIVQLLAKQLGVTSGEVTDLASKGKIDFKTFQAAMQDGLGGAAKKSGATASGAFANVKASLGRIGAGLLGGTFAHLPTAFTGITTALAPLETKAAGAGGAIARVLGPALDGIGPMITRLITKVSSVDFSHISSQIGRFKDQFTGLGQGQRGPPAALDQIRQSLSKLGGALKSVDLSALGKSLGQGTADSITVFSTVIGFAAKHVNTLAKALPLLVTAFATYKAAQAASNVLAIANIPLHYAQVASNFALTAAMRANTAAILGNNAEQNAGILTRIRGAAANVAQTASTVASTVAQRAAGAAARVWAAGQAVLNAVMSANPIALVIIAIVALVAGFVLAYKKSETFRNIVNGAFTAIKTVVGNVVGWFGKFVPRVLGVALGVAKVYFTVYRAVVVAVFRVVRAVITAAISAAVGAFNRGKAALSALGSAFTAAVKFVGRFASGVKSKVGEALGFIRSIPGKAVHALGNLGGLLVHAGSELIAGLARGIESKIQGVLDKVRGIAQKVKNLWPGSPVKEGPLTSWNNGGAGKRLMAGLAGGIDAGGRHVDTAMRKVADKTAKRGKEAAAKALAAARNVFKDRASTLADSMKDALGKLNDAQQEAADYAKGVRDNFLAAGNVSDSTLGSTAKSIVKTLTSRVATAQQFVATISSLRSSGLNEGSLQDLITAGPQQALASAQAILKGGVATVAQINTLEGQLATAGQGLGDSTANVLYGAGVQAAQGLVNGLASQEAAMVAQARKFGLAFTQTIQKTFDLPVTGGKATGGKKPPKKSSRVTNLQTDSRRVALSANRSTATTGGRTVNNTYNIHESVNARATAREVARREALEGVS